MNKKGKSPVGQAKSGRVEREWRGPGPQTKQPARRAQRPGSTGPGPATVKPATAQEDCCGPGYGWVGASKPADTRAGAGP